MSRAIKTAYPRAYQSEFQVADGYRVIRGRLHGFNWKPIYRVTVEFESESEAREFLASLHDGRGFQFDLERPLHQPPAVPRIP